MHEIAGLYPEFYSIRVQCWLKNLEIPLNRATPQCCPEGFSGFHWPQYCRRYSRSLLLLVIDYQPTKSNNPDCAICCFAATCSNSRNSRVCKNADCVDQHEDDRNNFANAPSFLFWCDCKEGYIHRVGRNGKAVSNDGCISKFAYACFERYVLICMF